MAIRALPVIDTIPLARRFVEAGFNVPWLSGIRASTACDWRIQVPLRIQLTLNAACSRDRGDKRWLARNVADFACRSAPLCSGISRERVWERQRSGRHSGGAISSACSSTGSMLPRPVPFRKMQNRSDALCRCPRRGGVKSVGFRCGRYRYGTRFEIRSSSVTSGVQRIGRGTSSSSSIMLA